MEYPSQINETMQRVAMAIERHTDQVLQERIGIGVAQFKILQLLHEWPHMRQARMAERLGQTEASVSRQIKLLTRKGLLTSSVDTKNRREHIHTLTPIGTKMTIAAGDVMQQALQSFFADLGDKQQKQLLELLTSVQNNVR